MSFDHLVDELSWRLTSEGREQLRELQRTPEAQQIVGRADERLQATRAALVSELEALPAHHRKQLAEAAKRRTAAEAALRDAEARLFAARAELMSATGAAIGLQHAEESHAGRLKAEIARTADRRLHRFVVLCDRLVDPVRHKSAITELISSGPARVSYSTNAVTVNNALNELRRVRDEAEALKLQAPMPRNAVTPHLQRLALDLAAALTPLDLNGPHLDDEANLVEGPAPARTISTH